MEEESKSPIKYVSTKVQLSWSIIDELEYEDGSDNSCSEDLDKLVPPGLLDDKEPKIQLRPKEDFLTGEELENLNIEDDDDDSSVSDKGSSKRIQQDLKEPEIKL